MTQQHIKIHIIGYESDERSGWGIARYTWQLIHNLKLKPEVEVIFTGCGTPSKNIIIRNLEKLIFFRRIPKLKGSLYHAVTPILAIPLAVLGRSPSMVTVHDLLHFYRGYGAHWFKMKFDLAYHGYVFDKVDAIITTAEYWRQDVIHRFNISAKKVFTVYNGCDNRKFKPMHKVRNSFPKRVLYVGSPTLLRGLRILIEAFSIVIREFNDVEFLIGGKTDRAYVSRLSKLFNVNVKHLGFIPEDKLSELYNSVHVFVNPPTDEFSLMLLEAMACGTPVIARDIFEMREYLGDAAFMVRSEEPGELAEAMIKLLSDEELWLRLSKRGLERARLFTWRKTAENAYNVYTKLLG